jgi:predicted ATPase
LLEELADHLDRAREGAGRLVVLAGEPGIGKTRTAAELVVSARGRGMKALVGRCHEDAGAPAYWPWRQVLRELVRGERGAELAAAVAPAFRTVARIVPDVAVPDGDRTHKRGIRPDFLPPGQSNQLAPRRRSGSA